MKLRHHAALAALATAAALGSASAAPFVSNYEGSGSIETSEGEVIQYSFVPSSENDRLNDSRTRRDIEDLIEGAMHVRAFGRQEGEDVYNFVNSAGALGRATATAQTTIGLTFTNDGTGAQKITLTSEFLPGAMGIYFSGGCGTFNEGESTDVFSCPLDNQDGFTFADQLSATTALDIDVFANGKLVDGFNLSLGVGGTALVDADLEDAAKLNGFERLSGPDEDDAVFYKWDTSFVNFTGGTINPGETLSIEVVFRSIVEVRHVDPTCITCLTAFMGFGDPIGGGGDGNNRFQFDRFDTNFTAEAQLTGMLTPVSPVPVPGAVWLMGAGIAALGARARARR